MVKTSKRLDGIGEYYFSQKLREIDSLNREGKKIINLGIGNPDLPPHPEIIKVLQEESAKTHVHGYQSYRGLTVLREAIANWYKNRYSAILNPDSEILPLMGSKEGIMHIAMTYLNPGDEVLVPNPGYPTYRAASQIAGAVVKEYALKKEGDWLPDFKALQQMNLEKVKIIWLNYPHMPTGRLANKKLFENWVTFAQKNQILLVHDNPYSFILNDYPMSILSVNGAKEVCIELNSISKSHNMAGWRLGMLLGSEFRVNDVLRFKSNMDSGMFLPIQLAAAAALSLPDTWYEDLNLQYRNRREKAYALLDLLNCSFDPDQAGMFLWAHIPPGFADSFSFSDYILNTSQIFITPGGIFGSEGNHFVRISLCNPESIFEESIQKVLGSISILNSTYV